MARRGIEMYAVWRHALGVKEESSAEGTGRPVSLPVGCAFEVPAKAGMEGLFRASLGRNC